MITGRVPDTAAADLFGQVRAMFRARDHALGKVLFPEADWERTRLAYDILEGVADIADIGIGQGQLVNVLARRPGIRAVHAYDFRKHSKLIEPDAPAYAFREWDITKPPGFTPASVDVVVAMEVLEHIDVDDFEATLDRIRQLSRTRTILVTVPYRETPPLFHHDKPHGHKQSFDDQAIERLFRGNMIYADCMKRWYVVLLTGGPTTCRKLTLPDFSAAARAMATQAAGRPHRPRGGETARTPRPSDLIPEHFRVDTIADYDTRIAALQTTGFVAPGREDLAPLPFRLPLDWNRDPYKDRNWMNQLHAWRMLDPHLNKLIALPPAPRRTFALPWRAARRDTTIPDCFSFIVNVMEDWHRANVRGTPSPSTWQDAPTGLRAGKLALLTMLARRHGVRLQGERLISELVDLHIEDLSVPEKFANNNHGLSQINGLMALAHACPQSAGSDAARTYAINRMSELIANQFGERGVHTENSPGYHFFAIRLIDGFLSAPWWQTDAMAEARAKLARAKDAGPWLVDPAGRCIPIGDSGTGVVPGNVAGLRTWPHRERGDTIGAVVDGYGVVRTTPDLPPERSAMLFLTASFRSGTHKHADCLSFVWQENGKDILIDSGKYGYKSDWMRKYFVSTRAHNTVELDERGFSRDKENAYGTGIVGVTPLQSSWRIDAEAPHPTRSIHRRRTVFFRPRSHVLVIDHVAATDHALQDRLFTTWWHFDPALRLSGTDHPGAWSATDRNGGRDVSVLFACNSAEITSAVFTGSKTPRRQGWISRGYLKYKPTPSLGFSTHARLPYLGVTLFDLSKSSANGEYRPRFIKKQNAFYIGETLNGCYEHRIEDYTISISNSLL